MKKRLTALLSICMIVLTACGQAGSVPQGAPNNTDQSVLDILSEMTIRGNDAKFRLMTDDAPPPKERKSFRSKKDFGKKPKGKEKPFREFHGDKPFRKTRRFGRH